MYIHNIGFIPCGTHNYNGHIWIVDKTSIRKSIPFYPDKFVIVDCSDIIARIEIAGLHRTITGK